MNVLIFGGSGKIDTAVARDLDKADAVETVGLVGRRKDALESVRLV